MIGAILLLAAAAAAAPPAQPAPPRGGIAVADSFRVGTSGVLCTAQIRPTDPRLTGMFDRGYSVVCRDAAAPVGTLYAVRATEPDPAPALIAARGDLACQPSAKAVVEGVPDAMLTECTARAGGVRYRLYTVTIGRTRYIAEGLGGYDSALTLGLRTLIAGRPVTGAVEVATTAAGDPAAFARVQAGALDADAALAEAYQRNNAGSFAEAAEFFEALGQRGGKGGAAKTGEYLSNQAIQQSNLGNFAAAADLFRQAERRGARTDAIAGRLLRNGEAMDALNRRDPDAALMSLAAKVPPPPGAGAADTLSGGVIAPPLAEQINGQNAALARLAGVEGRLTLEERARILDGQAGQLRGIALRQKGDYPGALAAFDAAETMMASVREGRVASTAFIRSETTAERALAAEAQGDLAAAERDLAGSITILTIDYPQSAALLAARARLGAFLARHGRTDAAIATYQAVVADSQQVPGSAATMRELLAPYFALLAPRVDRDPALAGAMFAASQILVRPGVAQTQAVLARELSGGDDAAAALFRESVNLSREIARASGDVARLGAADTPQPAELAAAAARLAQTQAAQTAIQARLADYPRYRAIAPTSLSLDELRRSLRPGELYYQMRLVGQDVYAMAITRDGARGARLALTADGLEAEVRALRDSIVTIQNGQTITAPFDVGRARALYVALFGPFGAPLGQVNNLIFEPDGAMLQLPPNLLITEQAGVDAYARRMKARSADPFDYRAIAWLGRGRDVTTAVSPRAFVEVRGIRPAKGRFAYLGLGHNAPAPARLLFASEPPGAADCRWPLQAWNNPISAAELKLASGIMGGARSALLTGEAFSDTALKARTDLDQYRVLHFATHGLVTAPYPQCPARPALLTSFGDDSSDGLLSFGEIYDLRLDADLVVLSACDTAGMATVEATREAGVATGGNFALDGLVRAFVGAGARSVIASHWPIPDDYGATSRLMRNLFSAPPGTPMAAALRRGQTELMDTAETSHPFYWAAFAILGDGERPVAQR